MRSTFSVQNDHSLEELWNGWISKNYELQRNFLCDFIWSVHFLQYLQSISEVSGASRRELIHAKGEDLAWARPGPVLARKWRFNWDRHRDDAVVHQLRTYAIWSAPILPWQSRRTECERFLGHSTCSFGSRSAEHMSLHQTDLPCTAKAKDSPPPVT